MNVFIWLKIQSFPVKIIIFLLTSINIISFIVIGRSLLSLEIVSNSTTNKPVTITRIASVTPTVLLTLTPSVTIPVTTLVPVTQTLLPDVTKLVATPSVVTITKQLITTKIATPTPTPTVVAGTIYITQTVTQDGVTFIENTQMPAVGGPIKGTVTGSCKGSITGTYTGPGSYAMQGKNPSPISCTNGFLSVNINESFTGTISPNPKTYQLKYSVTGTGINQAGTQTGNYTIK